jgi:DNA-binding response OmpR family regulator
MVNEPIRDVLGKPLDDKADTKLMVPKRDEGGANAMLLLCEDDVMLGRAIAEGLGCDFQVDWVRNLVDARLAMETTAYELAVLDLELPDGSGLDLLRAMRRRGDAMAVIILTARNTPNQRVEGLQSGADDYVGKPFDLGELIARCHVAIRRARGQSVAETVLGDLRYNKEGHRLTRHGQDINLSSRELRVFDILAAHAGAIVSKDQIEERLHHITGDLESNAVEVYVSRLRRKIGHDTIKTVRGIGYMLAKA